jgi:hypothetical protein
MKIQDLRLEERDQFTRAAAKVIWEDVDRHEQEIFFSVPAEFGSYLSCNPHAFLVASILPAISRGEQRIVIDEQVCPELKEGLATVVQCFRVWFGPDMNMPRLETKGTRNGSVFDNSREAGAFISGGIDSLALLRSNHLSYDRDHSRFIKKCFVVYGFDVVVIPEHEKLFEQMLESLSDVTRDAGVELVPVYTNVRVLNDDDQFWQHQFHGAALASVGHLFARVISSISISSSNDLANLRPWASQPLIDPNYSSADLRVLHDGVRYSRLAKTKLVADWEIGLRNLRVCTYVDRVIKENTGYLNCGRCEKCMRTKAELLLLGVLEKAPVFSNKEVTKELLSNVAISYDYAMASYREMIPPFTLQGRIDLVNAMKKIIFEYRIRQTLKHLDARFCKGRIRQLKKRFLG